MLKARSVVGVYVRHKISCPSLHRGEFYRGCPCPKWLRYSAGSQHRKPAGTRTWGVAEEKAAELQQKLDAGKTGIIVARQDTDHPTIEQAIETFLNGKASEGLSAATIRKHRRQLTRFREFMDERSKFFPVEITATDVIEYRASWKWESGVTRQKVQQNLRGFLRSCCRTNLPDLLSALKTIKLSKADRERLKPQPFTEQELAHLIAQVPKTFPDTVKVRKMTALIHCMVATGLAIVDTVLLERASINDGWLRIERRKTGKSVQQKLDDALVEELLSVASEPSPYIFWSGRGLVTSATGQWQQDLKTLMQDAGLWIRGNLSHRFRDTSVDFWLGAGCSMTEVAAALGDTVAVCERHYSDLSSKRMGQRLATMPTRSWPQENR